MDREKKDEILYSGIDDFIGKLIVEVMQLPPAHRVAKSVLSTTLHQWADGKYLKGKIAGLTEKILTKLFLEQKGEHESNLLNDAPAQIGHLLTGGLRSLNELSKSNPGFLADSLKVPLHDLIVSLDFGELKEAVDGLEHVLPLLFRTVNDEMENYPAKFVSLVDCVPSFVNTGILAMNEFIRPLNNMNPEILADVIFSLLRSLHGKDIGLLSNALMELSRKMYTGSAIIVDAYQSQFYIDAQSLLHDIVSTINPDLLYKFQVAWAEALETITRSYTDALSNNPKTYTAMVASYSDKKNPQIRSAKLKLSMYESLPEEEVAHAVSAGLAGLDTREIGEMINVIIRYIKLIHTHKPELIPHVISEVALSVDTEELKTVADSVINDIVQAIKPTVQVLLPSLLKGLTSLLTSDDGPESDDMNEALLALRKILMHKEA